MTFGAHSARDELLDKAKYGLISADEAEAEAKRLGLEPFARVPEPGDFDPMAEANWTLPMAVKWIAYRTADTVREAWPVYREECWHWIWRRWRNGPEGEVHEGWFLEQRRFPSLPLIELSEIVDRAEGSEAPSSQIMTVREAREALWIALGEGMLPATAVPRLGGPRVTIPPEEWSGLAPKDSDHRDELSGNGWGLAYVEMLVPSKAMTQLWRPPRPRASLPPPMRPDGLGYMPLTCAAQWIATEGGNCDFDPADQTKWKGAYDELLNAIASDKVRVVGQRNGGRELVPGFHFAGIAVDYPFTDTTIDMILSETIYLQCYSYTDEEHWRKTFHDSLVTRHRDHWTHLQVEKGDVRGLWPFGAGQQPTRSGAPGRPTSMHLVEQELERRASAGNLEASIRKQADALAAWFAANHADMPPLTAKTIRNRIGASFRRLAATAR